jgi:pimeloyl-[acyl-carrier protein] methyl ester esterase
MKLHVESSGHGPDLVLLHGWGLHSGAWEEVAPALRKRFRMHAIDLPGHGYSASVAARSFEEAVDAIAALVPMNAVVCGWSLGGLVAQRLARSHPERVSRLALVATTPCFQARPGWPHGMKAATITGFATALANDRDGMLKRFVALNAMHGPQGREAVRTFTRRLSERGVPSDAGLAASLGWLREVDLREETPQLRVPAMVMHGSRDMLAPAKAGRWLAQHLAGSRFIEIPDAAHMPFFSHPQAFVEAMESLVD